MSNAALDHVWSLNVGNGARKLILVALARAADARGEGACVLARDLAAFAQCDVRSAQRHVAWLLEHGYITAGDSARAPGLPGQRPAVYDLAMRGEHEQTRAQAPELPGDGRRWDARGLSESRAVVGPVLYALYDADDELAYVGSTGDFGTRLRDHRRKGDRGRHRWVAVEYPTRDAAAEAESAYLAGFVPYLNRRRSA